jgi:hypothetical protein
MLEADFSSYQKDVYSTGTKLYSALLSDIKLSRVIQKFLNQHGGSHIVHHIFLNRRVLFQPKAYKLCIYYGVIFDRNSMLYVLSV